MEAFFYLCKYSIELFEGASPIVTHKGFMSLNSDGIYCRIYNVLMANLMCL